VLHTGAPVFAEASTTIKSYYSPIVRLEPEKGYLLITTDSGIQWIQVEDTANCDQIMFLLFSNPGNLREVPLLAKSLMAKPAARNKEVLFPVTLLPTSLFQP
jgi:hypothetical protein